MADYLTILLQPASLLLIGAAVGSVVLVIWGLLTFATLGRKKEVYVPKILSEWRRTEHVDFQGPDDIMLSEQDDLEAQFVLLVQEQRLVANISGMPTPEIRWRYATKGEAKEIAHMVAMHREVQKTRSHLAVYNRTYEATDGSGLVGVGIPNGTSAFGPSVLPRSVKDPHAVPAASDLRELDRLNEVEART
jgi:hypothetical protein